MSGYIWSNDFARLRTLLESKQEIFVRSMSMGLVGVNLHGDRLFFNHENRLQCSWDDLQKSFEENGWKFLDPNPLRQIAVNVEGTELFKVEVVDPTASPKFKALRQQLCRQHDALTSAIADCGPTRNTRELRNAMSDLSNTVEAIATFTGSVSIESLPANYSTLSRYIP